MHILQRFTRKIHLKRTLLFGDKHIRIVICKLKNDNNIYYFVPFNEKEKEKISSLKEKKLL